MPTHYLACDLGAESGRLILGTVQNGKLALKEMHRFPNTPLKSQQSLHWDILKLFDELKIGLRKAATTTVPISSISTGLVGSGLCALRVRSFVDPADLSLSRCSRSTRCGKRVGQGEVGEDLAETGIQFLPMNTIFQLASESPERLKGAALLLGIGDAFNYMLSGLARAEESLASTFQLYNPHLRNWSEIIDGGNGPAPTDLPTDCPFRLATRGLASRYRARNGAGSRRSDCKLFA